MSNDGPIVPAALEIIKRNEGLRLNAYQDVVGVWTIGYGHTGSDVTPGQTITQARADELLQQDLDKFEAGVDDRLTNEATANQFGAMVSLSYNIGLGNFNKSSVLRLHNEGDYAGAADAFLMWNKAGGNVFPGLARRREEERKLYLTDSPATPATVAPEAPPPQSELDAIKGFFKRIFSR